MKTRQFTRAALAAIGVPPDSPEEVEYSDVVLEDRQLSVLGYSALRECVFLNPDDGLTYSVTYNGPINTGDWEFDDSGVPYGITADTIEATQVEQVLTIAEVWEPVDSAPAADADTEDTPRSALQQLVDLYEEGSARTRDARQWAEELLAQLAAEAGVELPCTHEVTAEHERDGKRVQSRRCADCREPLDQIATDGAARTEKAFRDAAGRTGYEGDTVGGTTSGRYQSTLLGPVVKVGKGRVKVRTTIGASGSMRAAAGDEVWISTDRVFLTTPAADR